MVYLLEIMGLVANKFRCINKYIWIRIITEAWNYELEIYLRLNMATVHELLNELWFQYN